MSQSDLTAVRASRPADREAYLNKSKAEQKQ
jgi:hypothetical protein